MNSVERNAYLSQYQHLWRDLHYYQERITQLRSVAERVTTSLSPVAGTSSGASGRSLESASIALVEAETEYSALMQSALNELLTLERLFAAVADTRMRQVLRLRYIDGLAWEEIADTLGCSIRQALRFRESAVNSIPDEFFPQN